MSAEPPWQGFSWGIAGINPVRNRSTDTAGVVATLTFAGLVISLGSVIFNFKQVHESLHRQGERSVRETIINVTSASKNNMNLQFNIESLARKLADKRKKTKKMTGEISAGSRWLRTAQQPEKIIIIVTVGRTGSTTLMAVLNQCITDAFIQGENGLNVWWLYKYYMETAAYEWYTARASQEYIRGLVNRTSFPFYRKVTPSQIESPLRNLVLETITAGATPRVAGFKEIRYIAMMQNDEKDLRVRRNGKCPLDYAGDDHDSVFTGYLKLNKTAIDGWADCGLESRQERLLHFLNWLVKFLPNVHVLVLTRDPEGASHSGWYKSNPDAVKNLQEQMLILKSLTRAAFPVFHLRFEQVFNKSEVMFRDMFSFLKEPFDKKCVMEELGKRHSF